jgi:hypothetical protein
MAPRVTIPVPHSLPLSNAVLTIRDNLLDDPGVLEPDVRHVAWRLFHVDEDDRPVDVIGCLHESVLVTDPKVEIWTCRSDALQRICGRCVSAARLVSCVA